VKEDVIGVGGLYLCHLEQVTPHHGWLAQAPDA
jgi:hypothetical protein